MQGARSGLESEIFIISERGDAEVKAVWEKRGKGRGGTDGQKALGRKPESRRSKAEIRNSAKRRTSNLELRPSAFGLRPSDFPLPQHDSKSDRGFGNRFGFERRGQVCGLANQLQRR